MSAAGAGFTLRCPQCDTPSFVSSVRLARVNDEPIRCWKCDAFVDHGKVKLEPVRENRHQSLMGRPVEVLSAGILYRGTFVEMTDEDVKLRGPTGWILLPVGRVTSVKAADAPAPSFPREKSVDPGFYDPDQD